MKLLLLEDDDILNEVIYAFLTSKGYDVVVAYDGEEAQELLYKELFDLLLLDVNVPSVNGFDLLRDLRDHQILTPVIFITSLNDTQDLKEGFDSGCDDYIKKPFEFDELELRINNIKRLYKLDNNQTEILKPGILYDFKSSSILINDCPTVLSKKESTVFEYFLKNRDRIISIEELIANVWTYEDAPTHSTVRTYIKNFRKILGETCIETIKGVGYRFN
ncbi:response regulator transcription factor [Sulfurospirillum sp. 1612]|uniref:response regulator transcription factor n=1 Tax=Sulfurospirillum sp. 1612 TaxID=3094835 RepID=UPI002F91C44B